MKTAYNTACYFARQAADLCRFNGLSVSGFGRLAAPVMGAIWFFDHADSGLRILLNANGTVNAPATKAAHIAKAAAVAADLAAAEAAAAEAAAAAARAEARAAFQALFGLAPVAPAVESPLVPFRADLAAAVRAYGRGLI